MKRLICILAVLSTFIFAVPGWADVRTYTLFLGTSDSGNTTAASGTSNLIVQGASYQRITGASKITDMHKFGEGEVSTVVQIEEITVSQHAQGQGGDNSGTTFTLRYRETVLSGTTYDNAASTTDIFTGTLLSGTTQRQTVIYPELLGDIEFQVLSGITPLEQFKAVVRFVD